MALAAYVERMAYSIINERRSPRSCEGSMPQNRGMPGPGSRSGWVVEQGEGRGDKGRVFLEGETRKGDNI